MNLTFENKTPGSTATEILRRQLPARVKSYFFHPTFALVFLLCGCVTPHHNLALEPVGPSPRNSTATTSTNGMLEVYSAYEACPVYDKYGDMQSDTIQKYSGYKIFSPNGKLLRVVQNDRGKVIPFPELVQLPPGTYRVVARAHGFGHVTVPTIIKSNEMTVIHLEGDDLWPNKSLFTKANAVYLSDGQVVGWKGAAQGTPEM